MVETIEGADASPWITGVRLEPVELGAVELVGVDEGRETDPTLCRRLYRFEVRHGALEAGTYTGEFRLLVDEEQAQPPDSAVASIEILSRLAFFPPRLEFVSGPGMAKTQTVTVVDRLAGRSVSVIDFDEESLDARRADRGQSQCAFGIRARSDAAAGRSVVTFSTDDGWRDTLPVEIGG